MLKNKTAFSGYGRSYKIEIVDKKDVIVQLESSEIALKELFKDFLLQLKGFKYQITLCILLSKVKNSGLTEYRSVYFNSLTKTVIGDDYFINECFNEITFRLENWISHRSGWIVHDILSQYLNLSNYIPLSGSTYIKLPKELQHSKNRLIK